MNLEKLMQEWTERDQRLESSIRLNTRLLRQSQVDRHGSSVRRTALVNFLIELPFYLVTIFVLSKFMTSHVSEMKFFVPGLLLNAWCIAMLGALIQQFAVMYRLDLGEPIIALQKKLVAIRMARLRMIKWGFVTGLLVWCAPFLIVLAKGVLNVDLYSASGWLLYNTAGAGVLVIFTLLVVQRYASRMPSTRVKRFLDTLAGSDIEKANVFLTRLSNFERDEAVA
jgi:hypothetical protein